jgi:hypothetical protein
MSSTYLGRPPALWIFLLIALTVTLSRLHFLGTSYGSVPDAWRVFMASQHLAATGEYVPSRFPGYPLPEYFYALMAKAGFSSAFVFELPVAILSAIAAGLFFLILLPFGYLPAAALSFALAFTPAYFVASTQSIDYIYGFTFFVAAALAAFRGKTILCGVLLGLAAASRPTYALAYIPLALALLDFRFEREELLSSLKKLAVLAAVSAGTAAIFYAQLFYEYGLSFLTAVEGSPSFLELVRSVPLQMFGSIGVLGMALAAMATIVAFLKHKGSFVQHRSLLLFALTTAVIYLLVFFRLPNRTAYLLPVLPAIYICLAAGLSPRWAAALPAVLLASGFLSIKHEGLRLGGVVLADQRYQESFRCVSAEVANKARNLDAETYILAGYLFPTLKVLMPGSLSQRVIYAVDEVTPEGYRAHEEDRLLPLTTRFLVIDRVEPSIRGFPGQPQIQGSIDTTTGC